MSPVRSTVILVARALLAIAACFAAADAAHAQDDATDPPPATPHRVDGRVVDSRRFPVRGVAVRFVRLDGTTRSAKSGEDGRYRVDLPVRVGEPARWVAHAFTSDGRTAVRGFLVQAGWREPVRLPPLALQAGRVADVLVVTGARPVQDADVFVITRIGKRGVMQRARTDATGRVRLGGIPSTRAQIAATAPGYGRTLVELPDDEPVDGPLRIELHRARERVIRVLDAATGLPVAGARFDVWDDAGFVRDPFIPLRALAATDERGETRHSGDGLDGRFEVRASVPGRRPSGDVGLAREGVTLVELPRTRTLRWPIDPGSTGVPPDGTPLRVVQSDGMHFHWSPSEGRVAGGAVVIDGCDEGFVSPYAITPDGRIANLVYDLATDAGARVSFREPRTIDVRLMRQDGTPAAHRLVHLRTYGASLGGGRRRTDSAGRVRWEGVHADLSAIEVDGRELAELETWRTSSEVNLTLPPEHAYTLEVRLDGEPRLPATYRLEVNGRGRVPEEDPHRGTLTFRAFPTHGGRSVRYRLQSAGRADADGYLTVEERTAAADLVSTVTLLLDVRAPEGVEPWYEARVQRRESDTDAWYTVTSWRGLLGAERDAHGRFRLSGMLPGTYRLRAATTGQLSEPVVVRAGGAAQLQLDASAVRVVHGRVSVPEGYDASSTRIAVRDETTDQVLDARRESSDGPVTRAVERDGSFAFRVPARAAVRLEPEHPLLDAGPTRREHDAALGERVVLELRPAPIGRVRVAPAPHVRAGPWFDLWLRARRRPIDPTRVLLVRGGEPEALDQPLVWTAQDTLRFRVPVGFRGDVWLDLPGLVPHRVDTVRFDVGENDLGDLRLTRGSSLRVSPIVPDGAEWPRVHVRVRARAAPGAERYGSSLDPSRAIAVHGLGAGEHDVRVHARYELRGRWRDRSFHATVVADGRDAVHVDADLR